MNLDSSLINIKGVGSVISKKLEPLNITTVNDLIEYFPRKYDDYSNVESISQLKPGQVSLEGEIKQVLGRYVRRGMHITEAVASDKSGSVRLIWFNQPYRAKAIKPGAKYYISGEFALSRQRLSIMNPSIELASIFNVSTARIVPIYRETKGLKSVHIRKILSQLMPYILNLPETLPAWIVQECKLMSRSQAVAEIHFPNSNKSLEEARRRLGFEEVFALTLASLLNKAEFSKEHALSIKFDKGLAKEFVASLPFKLTDAQRKTVWQIYLDMQKTQPMNRLLEGDVGSGKTVVAIMSALMVIRQGFQVALMAPTELLARQHAETIYNHLKLVNMQSIVGLLIGGLSPSQKKLAQTNIKSGAIKFMIGTHALIQQKIDMHNLGLVIIDEQHRFGVEERKKLQSKAGHAVHVLNMTATPIPRSLALTLYGEMDISIIDTKPIGRKPIITKIESPNSRAQLYKKIDKELNAGRQIFVVTPLISESEFLPVRSVEDVYKELSLKTFKNWRVGILHGKMKTEEKEKIMKSFLYHKLDILVTTTVIEVGIDIPNATVMLIENAERFGLAQIHQLRGRVGRSNKQGYCYLMLGNSLQPSRRLKALESSNDGFKLAELDLEIRGPGAIYGTNQHGLLDLRIAKLTDVKLIALARQTAQMFIDKKENLLQYSQLQQHVNKLRAVTNLN